MARLMTGVLGKVSGALGSITFRLRNGKNVIATRPVSYTAPDDEASVARRQRFRSSAKIAAAIISVPLLKAIWERETPPGMSAFNNVVKTDVELVDTDSISNLTAIVPGIGFHAAATNVAVGSDSIAVTLAQLEAAAGIDTSIEPNVRLAAILCLEDPVNRTLDTPRFVGLVSDSQQVITDAAMTFKITPGAHDSALISSYGTKKTLFALITLDAGQNPVRYSDTFGPQ